MKSNASVHFSELENEINQYVYEHVDDVQLMSIRQLAKCTYSNTTSIVRYCKKLGYSGFEEFKIKIKNDLQSQKPAGYIVTAKETSINIINKMRTLNREVIEKTVNSLSLEQLSRITAAIDQAETIDFIAYDANSALADYAAHYFFQVGKICNVYSDIDEQIIFSLRAKKENHVVFVLTRSGKTKRIIKVLRQLKAHGFYTILISCSSAAAAKLYCSEFLETIFIDSFKEMSDCAYYTSAKFLLDLIINLYYSQHYDSVLKNDKEYNLILND